MNFIGLYDIGRLCWSDGLKLAVDFFNLLGETPDSFFYQEIGLNCRCRGWVRVRTLPDL
jgi:hypothetical protein